jgi:tRNA1Val (adenine37-N6)-methyltransferase
MGKRNSSFHFKQFDIDHSKSSMKVGTDGVLLGAWTDVSDAKSILDVGTGSGLIALMLAQRTGNEVTIEGVDIDEVDILQAQENILNSPWAKKVKVFCCPIQDWNPKHKYDLLVSNPPYFVNSFEPPDKKRITSRHTVTLSHSDLLEAAFRLLKTEGRINVILPTVEGIQFMKAGESMGFSCTKLFSFRPRKNKPVERWLIELTLASSAITKGEIVMYEEGNTWSEAYKTLTREFYLKI